ncbi:hypothetical protein V2J09_021479 [Rumex salicifolius]
MVCGIFYAFPLSCDIILLDEGIFFLDSPKPEPESGAVVKEEDEVYDPSECKEEPFEDHVDAISQTSMADLNPEMISDDTLFELPPLFQNNESPFTDDEFHALMNNEQMIDTMNNELSDSTFHSLHNSFLSSSMINHLGGLQFQQEKIQRRGRRYNLIHPDGSQKNKGSDLFMFGSSGGLISFTLSDSLELFWFRFV